MKRLTDISGFLSGLGSTRTIVMHSGCAEPRLLARQLANHAHEVLGTRLITLMTMGDAPYLDADRASYLDIQTFFPGRAIRSAFNAGLVRPLRYPLSAIPALFTRRAIQVDAIFLQVSPPDVTGHVSLGVSLDYMREVIDQTPVILAEINPQMPHTSGRTRVHVSQIDWFVDAEGGPQQVAPGTGDPIDDLIARNVAGIVRDGAVLQIGMGALPDRVLSKLGHAKHLGLHSGIVTDTVRPLIESGVIDNTTKQAHAGVSITTMAAGTQSFYDFLHRNAAIEFHGCAYTHCASVISKIDGFCAINSALQVDLQGNINVELIGKRRVALPGGLPDFAAGASRAHNGQSIIAVRSSHGDGDAAQSNIIAAFEPNIPIAVPGLHVDFVVTEYGAAGLRGLSPSQRAAALVAVSHPRDRETLARSVALA